MAVKNDYDLNLLTIYLMSRSKNEIKMSIDEIERIACGKLPDFMHTYSGSYRFWYNDYNRNPSYAHYWLDAGYFAQPDFNNSVVYFTKSVDKFIKRKTDYKKPAAVKKADINLDTALNAIKKYHNSVNSNYTRYKSWEHCYNAFKKYRKDESKTELLCLHLSCYLASWGMLRRSCLMNYDYFVHKPFIEEISKPKYDELYSDFCDIDSIFQAVKELRINIRMISHQRIHLKRKYYWACSVVLLLTINISDKRLKNIKFVLLILMNVLWLNFIHFIMIIKRLLRICESNLKVMGRHIRL